MKTKKAIRLLLPDRPLCAGAGRCRASFSGQDSHHSLIDEKLHIPFSAIQLPTSKGTDVVPQGQHRLPIFLTLPSNLPGTFRGKFGAIAYRFIIKLKVKRFISGDEATIECEKAADVLPRVSLDQQPSFANHVIIDRHVKKKTLFMNRLDAKIRIEIDKAAFIVGQHILMSGEIKNEHATNSIRHVTIELRQHILYASGDAQRIDHRLITKLIVGSVPPNETFNIHHSLSIPIDCYPTLCWNGSPVQVAYELLLTNSGNFELGIPVFIGNCGPSTNRRSIMYPESTCDQTSTYYCVPPSEFSFAPSMHPDPPPYSTYKPESIFIPIHLLKTPYRPFAPSYGMPGMFHSGPPEYDYNFNRNSPPPQRFLKIEEIE
ncbi:unnamed protein product [Caenorhabditis bovis]|uniref:Arrestin C-terminal-like domain-containing protein n=1 Tax=Caenorhabditis bovis TaxID=2654633 RepID=A0A8S1EQR4_9PELO|nr:unnamed protein product [Caenorhabditis bovis]